MRGGFAACCIAALSMPAHAKVPQDAIVLKGYCASNSRVGQGNMFQDQWMLSHQLARPFRCSRLVIEPKSDGTTWLIFDNGDSTMRAHSPVMIFIGGADRSSAKREIDVIGGQAYYGNFKGDTYAWTGQVTCFIHTRTRAPKDAYKVTCTAVVNRGSDEKVMAAVFIR